MVDGTKTEKYKTAHIISHLNDPNYMCKPQDILSQLSKQDTKSLLISRFHMLECGRNYKGTMDENCSHCTSIDDENHRLNHCPKYGQTNCHDSPNGVPFCDIYSDNVDKVRPVIASIGQVWDTKNGHGSIKDA